MNIQTKQKRIQKIAKVLAVLLKIGRIALIAALSLELVAVIWMAASPGAALFKLGRVTVVAPFFIPGWTSNPQEAMNIVIAMVGQVVVLAILRHGYRIFKDVSREDSPFQLKHVKRLKVVAILMLFTGFTVPDTGSGINVFLGGYNMALSLFPIVFAVMFYCLALVFEYGCTLQQQSDETL